MNNNLETANRMLREQLVTRGDLEQLKNDLIGAMKSVMNNGNSKSSKPYLKSDEVRKLLGISSGKLLTLRTTGVIPFTKIGGVVYFEAADIQRLFEKNKAPKR